MNWDNRSSRRDELIQRAQELADALPEGSKSEMQKILHYYLRHESYGQMMELLKIRQPNRGKDSQIRWQGVAAALKAKRERMELYQPGEIAFILGWATRLMHRSNN